MHLHYWIMKLWQKLLLNSVMDMFWIKQDLIFQGLTSHKTQYRSYQGRVFMGQMTQPTATKH